MLSIQQIREKRAKMLIAYNKSRDDYFSNMLKDHNFSNYLGLTHNYKGFEVPNLSKKAKISFLQKLNISNKDNLPSFENFWKWVITTHHEELAFQMASFLYPEVVRYSDKQIEDDKIAQERKSIHRQMVRDTNHPLWLHIKARMYKKWSSIMTEAQCTYALLTGIQVLNKDWKVLSSPLLDLVGIDVVLVTEKEVIPIQVKKDSTSMFTAHKKNNFNNYHRYNLPEYAQEEMLKEVKSLNLNIPIGRGLILKYDVQKTLEQSYKYLKKWNNGFVYFDATSLIRELEKNI